MLKVRKLTSLLEIARPIMGSCLIYQHQLSQI